MKHPGVVGTERRSRVAHRKFFVETIRRGMLFQKPKTSLRRSVTWGSINP
jgi:hypothetical protein